MKKVQRREPQPSFRERIRFTLPPHLQREILAVLLITLGLAIFLALFGLLGAVGPIVSEWMRRFIGLGAFLVAGALILVGGLWLVRNDSLFKDFPIAWGRLLAFEILLAALVGLAHLVLAAGTGGVSDVSGAELAANGQGGGYLGWAIASLLTRGVGSTLAVAGAATGAVATAAAGAATTWVAATGVR